MNELALFAGAGGGILGGKLLGWRTRCAVEIDAYARSVLLARQLDGCLDRFPVWDDVTTFDGKPWKGHIDIISGGFPCQDISVAGSGAGITGERSGLWKEFARIIGEVGPRFVLVENSPALTSRGLGTVLGDLASLGYDARWGVLGAVHTGAPHRRERIWIVADSVKRRCQPQNQSSAIEKVYYKVVCNDCARNVPDSNSARLEDRRQTGESAGPDESHRAMAQPQLERRGGSWWSSEPELGRVAHGMANRVDRIRAIGNGQVPAVVKLAWETLSK